ncbi:MAG TPA: transporter, partial [Syntrophorhabdaceae bacterium]|nr:transporter [Syntrophorhabdaceae bacterium]
SRIHNKCKKWVGVSFVFLAFLLIIPGLTFAARPLVTDDSGTIGKGNVQTELGIEVSSTRNTEADVKIKEKDTEASATLTYGVFDHIDIVAGFPYVWAKVKEDGETVFKANRHSDISLEVKWRFFEKDGFGLALKPCITFPAGNYKKGFGTGRATYGMTFIASKEMEPFGFHFNVGYNRNENKLQERKDLWSASFAATYEALKGLNIVGNIGTERNADPHIGTAPAFGIVGVNYSINDHIAIDTGFKFGLNKQEVDKAVIAGITLVF